MNWIWLEIGLDILVVIVAGVVLVWAIGEWKLNAWERRRNWRRLFGDRPRDWERVSEQQFRTIVDGDQVGATWKWPRGTWFQHRLNYTRRKRKF